jgi:putative transposase
MRANGLVGAHASKKWRRGRPDAGGLVDLLQRDFTASAPNQRWVADATEFPTDDGKLYLAGIQDLFHRGIVGWDTSGRQDSTHVVNALTMALTRTGHLSMSRTTPTRDRSTRRWTSRNSNVALSFGSTGDAFDNAAMETFWARLKVGIGWIRGQIVPLREVVAQHAVVLSFEPLCNGRRESQKYPGALSVAVAARCPARSVPWSQVLDRRSLGA